MLQLVLLAGCAPLGTSPEQVKTYSDRLFYVERPSDEAIISGATEAIRPSLKDPDSIKRVSIQDGRKCYEFSSNMSGDATPKYSFGYWCFKVSYYAKNSYGAYGGPADAFIIYTNEKEFLRMSRKQDTITASDKSYVYSAENPFMLPPGSQTR